MRRALLAAVLALALVGAAAPVAGAAVRFVAPAGGYVSGTCTTTATACTFLFALTTAANGDIVRLAPGTYPVGNGYAPITKAITIEGDPAGPRPVIFGSASAPGAWALTMSGGLAVTQAVRHLELRQIGSDSGFALVLNAGGLVTAEDVVASSSGVTVDISRNAVLRDSVVTSSGVGDTSGGPPSAAVRVGFASDANVQVRNVTAGGGAYALQARGSEYSNDGSVTTVRSSILRGTIAGVGASGYNGAKTALVLLDHSNFGTVQQLTSSIIDASGGGNVTAPPLFTDAVNANFRPLAGSPTIDAGVADSFTGTRDPDGNPRRLGAAPDIGAFEFVPPAPPPGPPAPAPVGAAADTSAPAITLAGLSRRVTASALRKGVKVRVTTSEAARLALTLTARKRGGAFLSAKRKPRTTTVTLGRASAPAGAATRTITIKASRRALGRATRLKATITVVATDAAGNAARRTATLAVAPARRR